MNGNIRECLFALFKHESLVNSTVIATGFLPVLQLLLLIVFFYQWAYVLQLKFKKK
jgi:hypothetical protein